MIFKSHTDLTDLTDYFFRCKQRVFSSGLNGKTPKESKIREIRKIRVGKLNITSVRDNELYLKAL